MPVSFGSIGDIIAICLLVKDLVAALDESKGSATEYGEVKLELRALERALLEVEVLSRSQASTVKLNALYATARKAALDCRQPIEAFLNMIKKYDSSLGAGVSRNLVRNTAMKIRWRLSQKDEVARIRAEISAHSSSINMLLATVNVNLAQTHHKDMSDQLSDSSNRQNALIREVRDQLEETNALVSASHAVTNKIKEALKLKWFNQLGAELKAMMLRIININIATYNSVISIQEVISGGLQRSLTHEPFILEDAIGRISPVHLQFINSWDALDAVLELRFRKIQGHTKVKRREYILQEHSTKREISRTRHWEGAFLPGQRIDMSLIFDTREQSRIETSCPSCKEVSKDSQDLEIQCQNCGIWYRRVTELLDEEELPMSPAPTSSRNRQTTAQFGKPSFNDISYGPKPPSQFPALPSSPKRKLDCTQLEEDDLSQFKRIRLVSKEKRQKVGPFLSYPVGEATFNAAQQQKRDEQTGWDEFHALRSSLGDTHPDTLAYLHSFTRSLRNWGKPEVLQLMLSGLLTVLVDQRKLVEAEDLWNTSVEMFRTKLGEVSANVLETQFQQAHPFRPGSSVSGKGAIFDATAKISAEVLSLVQSTSLIATSKGLQNYQDWDVSEPKRGERDWNGISGPLTPTPNVAIKLEAEHDRMKLEDNSSSSSPFAAENFMVWQKASDSLDSDVSSPGSDVSVNDQYEHDHSPSLTIKPAEALPHEKGSKGKYSLADFEVLRPLSTGSFARVHLVRSKNNSRFYTLKVRKKEQFVNKKRAEYMRDEIRVLSRIRHPFLIRFWGTFQDSKNRYIINEFLEGGDMLSLLREAQRFPNDVAKFYAAEVILAIEYLHAKNIIYRAIKPQNILLDRHGHLKLCNFGIAREVEDITWTICGTAGYLAPEVVSRQGYNLSADWWAVGILVYEMLCGYDPFSEDDSPLRTYENIRTGIVNYPPILHPDAHDLLQQLITADLTKRLGNTPRGAKDIKCHAWFAEVPWERLAKKDIDPPYVPPVMGGVGDASQYYERPKQTENCSDYGNVGNVGHRHLFQGF